MMVTKARPSVAPKRELVTKRADISQWFLQPLIRLTACHGLITSVVSLDQLLDPHFSAMSDQSIPNRDRARVSTVKWQ